jgi:hypothetical protein
LVAIQNWRKSVRVYDFVCAPDKNKRRKNTPMPSMNTRPTKLMRP